MSDDFVTVATLNTPTEASLVRNQLEAEGIRVFLSDEEAVGMAWYLGNAIGGIKVQVAAEDADRAFGLLDEHDPVTISEEDWKTVEGFENGWDEEEEDADAAEDTAEESAPERDLDQEVNRAFKAAVLGIIFFPIQVYSFFLLLDILFSGHSLTPVQQKKVKISLLLNTFILFCAYILLSRL
ncbi:putative signal transducing protein [Gimesia panareensis]|uniref:putative signal transducing protein n=1 Tax=Gimesia panareensis TaxID=2527978 RepID=UPI001189B4A0|nr:DUF2007 domain-containing protein [Gimesia panareensis]QDU51297.1 hypothetical protein Pan110_36610 [Gimesia panareensis]